MKSNKIDMTLRATAIVSLILIANFCGVRLLGTIAKEWQQN